MHYYIEYRYIPRTVPYFTESLRVLEKEMDFLGEAELWFWFGSGCDSGLSVNSESPGRHLVTCSNTVLLCWPL